MFTHPRKRYPCPLSTFSHVLPVCWKFDGYDFMIELFAELFD